MPDYFKSIQNLAAFSADKSTKTDLFASGQMLVGLNCFEPGQSQKTHVHAGSPANVPHGVLHVTERTVMLVAIAPPPHSAHASAPPAT
jgi:hypothetical protein